MPEFTQQQLVIFGIIAVAVLIEGARQWGAIKQLPGRIGAWIGGGKTDKTEEASDDRLEALRSLDEAYAFFKSVKCQEGMAGVRKLVGHVYDEDHSTEGQS